ncbi:MAG: M15 family metallopeptidase [Flavobacteriales bacterium]
MIKSILSLLFISTSLVLGSEQDTVMNYSKPDLLGQIDYAAHDDFTKIPSEFTSKTGVYLRAEALDAFKKMYFTAKECGVTLTIISAARNFDYQKGIWERKWKDGKYIKYMGAERAKAIMRYSSMPGTSRHHWGTDIDINNLNDSYFTKNPDGIKVYDWLTTHANSYGFYQTYTSKDSGRTGYEEEKWHWSYMPIAKQLLVQYNEKVAYSDIKNFNGSESAKPLQAIDLYVNGIDIELK